MKSAVRWCGVGVSLALAGCMATGPRHVESAQPRAQPQPQAPVPAVQEIAVTAPPQSPPQSAVEVSAPRAVAPAPVTQAVLRKRMEPNYPKEMLEQDQPGEVVLSFAIGETGVPEDVRIERSTHPAFSKAVMAVVPYWRFDPARAADGRVVRTRVRVPLKFRTD
ncbi:MULTISPECIES: TonB family protein [unclassified Variovorax]|uniref:TonB family protein n=1 Tax=unclassified Variovorax TaxID=663243 RepID=UPI000B83E5BB|nr:MULTISPECIES: TonB family protein [unclassified Variovorax]